MNIYVGRLSRNISEGKLKELFEQFGAVSSIKIIKINLPALQKDLLLLKWTMKLLMKQFQR